MIGILLVLALTGRRRAEGLGLRAADISLEGETVTNTYRGKGGKTGRRYLAAAGLAPTGLHVLRHTAAKLRRDAGASVEAVSAFLDTA